MKILFDRLDIVNHAQAAELEGRLLGMALHLVAP